MARQLLVLLLAVLCTGVHCILYDHTEKAIDVADLDDLVPVNIGEHFSYVGRHFSDIFLVPQWGCVSFGVPPGNIDAITFHNVQEYELVCPLFSQHGVATDSYVLKREIFEDTASTLFQQVTDDIKAVGDAFLDYTPKVEKILLVTWLDATAFNRHEEGGGVVPPNPSHLQDAKNTYQIAIALVKAENAAGSQAQQFKTFAIFNYDKIQWTGWTAKNTTAYKALAGMIYGDYKGHQALPFSHTDEEIISLLSKKSTVIGKPGRYIYDVTDVPQRIGCLDLPADHELELLTISESTADIFGGRVIKVQGQCRPSGATPKVYCGFQEIDEQDKPYWINEEANYQGDYTVVCKTPRLELGRSKIGFSSSALTFSYPFQAEFYVTTFTAATAPVRINYGSNKKFLEENAADNIVLSWVASVFGDTKERTLEVFIEAFKESETGSIITKSHKIGEVPGELNSFTFNVSNTQCDPSGGKESDCEGYLVGYFYVQIKDFAKTPITTKRVAISSIPIPIGWFVRNYHRARFGNSWYYQYCEATINSALEENTCPCSRNLVKFDSRQFTPAQDCDKDLPSSTCMLQADNSYCYNALTGGLHGLRCCYNSANDLIYSTDNGVTGSYMLPYFPWANYKTFNVPGAKTYLSYYVTHVKNHFACCSAQGVASQKTSYCANFALQANVNSRCFDHKPSSLTAVVGDPHFMLSDGQRFSFNGIGEFWYAKTTSDDQILQVQIRLGKATSKLATESPNNEVKAAIVKALALKHQNNIIQIQVQPLTYLNEKLAESKRLMIYINGREVMWTNDALIRYYDGFRIASSGVNQDKFHVTLFKNGGMVACDYVDNSGEGDEGPVSPGSMNCRISYSPDNILEINGLIGQSDGTTSKLVSSDGSSTADLNKPEIVYEIAKTWSVSEDDTFFSYIGTSWADINTQIDEEPEFNPEDYITGEKGPQEEKENCGEASAEYFKECSYDYRLTGSISIARGTKEKLSETFGMSDLLKKPQEYCEPLNLPLAIFNSNQGNKFNSEAEITGCIRNHIPSESVKFPVTIKCDPETKKWTGDKVVCIEDPLYDTTTANNIEDPYRRVSKVELGISDFSIVYLGKRLENIEASIHTGCISLSDVNEPGYEGLICPLVANHLKKAITPPVKDSFKFTSEVLTSTDESGTLATISTDIREVSKHLDDSTSEYGVKTAYIFSWIGATHNGADCSSQDRCDEQKRNTYQVVLAVGYNEKTYVIFNYGKIEWSGIEGNIENPSNKSVAGFYYGDMKGVLPLPYSGKNTAELAKLAEKGTMITKKGRYIFEVSSLTEPRRLGCYQTTDGLRSAEKLSISTGTFDIYGGNVLRVQGLCLSEGDFCAFEKPTLNEREWIKTPVRLLDGDFYTGLCDVPQLPEIDAGWREIVLEKGSDTRFRNRIYFGTAVNGGPLSQLDFSSPIGNFWLRTRPNTDVTVSWTETFSLDDIAEPLPLHLYIRGYKSNNETHEFGPIAHATTGNQSLHFSTKDVQCKGEKCEGILTGQFVLRVDPQTVRKLESKIFIDRTSISSVLMPIGWFTNDHHTATHQKATWHDDFCSTAAIPIGYVPQCPCTEALAEADNRLFFPSPDCLGWDRKCMFSPNAQKCYTTLPFGGKYSVRCCYDTTGFVLHATNSPIDGSYVLPDAVNYDHLNSNDLTGNTQLSFQLSHVQNYFACCSVNILQENQLTKSCSSLTYNRAIAKTCGASYSGWSAIAGDPHLVTLDGTKYTFNGVGEFWYLHSQSATTKSIQVRFAKTANNDGLLFNASTLQAIAFKYIDTTIEIHLQPPTMRRVGTGDRYLMILVDGKEYFWTSRENQQFAKRFRIDTNFNQYIVTVITQDNGPLITCQFIDIVSDKPMAGMNCRISLPNDYRRQTNGLSGYWDDEPMNDLTARDSTIFVPIIADPKNMLDVHNKFALSWRVKNDETLFTYFDDNWEKYNSEVDEFKPELKLPPNYGLYNESVITTACGPTGAANRDQCQYDYEVTLSEAFATKTRQYLSEVDRNKALLNSLTLPSCEYLDIPYAVVQFPNGTQVGSIAQVVNCLPGYRIVSDLPTFTCTQVGQNLPAWTPAPRTVCRGPERLYAEVIDAEPVDPFNPVLPTYTLPEDSNRATQGISYAGRLIDGFTWLPEIGCVALAKNVSISSALKKMLLDVRGTDVPLLCPLVVSHANVKGVSEDTYKLLFKQITPPSASLNEITRDIQAVSEGLDTMIDHLEVTNAYVFTWKDARAEGTDCSTADKCQRHLRNSYEVVLATTNQKTTYVLFSYQSILWNTFIDDGKQLNGYAGFHLGDNKGIIKLPYAEKNLLDIQWLLTMSTIRDFNGRFVYRVTDRVERLGCLSLPTAEPRNLQLTMNTYDADMYGGRRLVLQGECPPVTVSNWECLFSKNPFASGSWIATPAQRLNAYSVVCVPPHMPHVDVGEYVVALSIGSREALHYENKFYFSGTTSGTMPVRLVDNVGWFSVRSNRTFRVEWLTSEFGSESEMLNVHLRAYKLQSDKTFDYKEYSLGQAINSETGYQFGTNDYVCDNDCEGRLIGQVIVSVQDKKKGLLDSRNKQVSIASSIVPIGWFVNKWHETNKGNEWYYNYCEIEQRTPTLTCPCTASQAEDDTRLFAPTANCNDIFGSECTIQPSRAEKCFSTLPLTSTGAGLICCYDRSNNLIYPQDRMYGSYELPYTVTASESLFNVRGAVAYLSYYNSHAKNLFACCSAKSSESITHPKCYDFVASRSPNKKCTDYKTSGVTSIVGDPHVLTPDGTVYTFNGAGEFWWVFGDVTGNRGVRMQARFRKDFKTSYEGIRQGEIRASLLTSLAISYSDFVIQIEVQNPVALTQGSRQLVLYVQNIERQFTPDLDTMFYYGARIKSSALQNTIEILTAFDGPSVQCSFVMVRRDPTIGSMQCTILLPQQYKNKVFGLVGKWDGNKANDLIVRDDIEATVPATVDATNLTQVHEFGKTWRLLSEGESSFDYYGTSFEEVNKDVETFKPEMTMKPDNGQISQKDIDFYCTPNAMYKDRCEFDYRVTSAGDFAASTLDNLRSASNLQSVLAVAETDYCPHLEIPYAVKTYTNGLKVLSIAKVISCLAGYSKDPSSPPQYRCEKKNNAVNWTPAPSNTVCIKIPDGSTSRTTQAAPTGQTGGTSQAASATSTPSKPIEVVADDNTVEIILGVFMGIFGLVIIILIIYYFKSIKPKLSDKSERIEPLRSNVEFGERAYNTGAVNYSQSLPKATVASEISNF